jgi:O-antigen/teichoic acid export membrane protein
VCVAQTAAYWMASPVKITRPRRSRWKPLLARGGMLSTSSYFWGVTTYGDNLSLYFFQSEAVIGIYMFAFNLSTQTLQLLVANLGTSLMAVLTKLQGEPGRQAEALMRVSRALALVAVYLCVLQAAVAKQLLQFLYLHKWDDAVLLLQVLSIAMTFGTMSSASWALLRAQGRYRVEMRFQIVAAAVFLAVVLPAAIMGATTVAFAVLILYAAIYPSLMYIAVGGRRVGWTRVLAVFTTPLVCAMAACAVPLAIVYGIESVGFAALPGRAKSLVEGLMIGVISFPIYAGLMRMVWPEDFATVLGQVRGVLARVTRRTAPAAITAQTGQR